VSNRPKPFAEDGDKQRIFRDGVYAMSASAWIRANHDKLSDADRQLEATLLAVEQLARIGDILERAQNNCCFDIGSA
jgi:hypothetical protein